MKKKTKMKAHRKPTPKKAKRPTKRPAKPAAKKPAKRAPRPKPTRPSRPPAHAPRGELDVIQRTPIAELPGVGEQTGIVEPAQPVHEPAPPEAQPQIVPVQLPEALVQALNVLLNSVSTPATKQADVPDTKPMVRLTKVNEHWEIETRDFSCKCGADNCDNKLLHRTIVYRDGHAMGPPLGTRNVEATDFAHIKGAAVIRERITEEQAQAQDHLAHALGNCPCHGIDRPRA